MEVNNDTSQPLISENKRPIPNIYNNYIEL